ncbi:cytochrome C oxidase subunit II [Cohnella kolymensis]|uniref:Cytochrome C oxidase subunit II n=1 Tax=Cohnella kolymensis TaxID=1590652 RepID=A0ABR5A579_9BACL|nr:cupredoxin domain-containing protein [Cohnella kolymensis]KIL35808.1 cytochrome C oxidase subunit II [Cohnella kolymensis]
MKRITALVLFLSLLLSGCGGSNENSSNPTQGASEADSPSSSQPASQASPQPADNGVREIKVTASNFEFDQKEIRVKKGEKIKLTFESKEGAHGFSIPDLNIDLKEPGSVEFIADQAGEFPFACSVICGAGHSKMTGTFIVE